MPNAAKDPLAELRDGFGQLTEKLSEGLAVLTKENARLHEQNAILQKRLILEGKFPSWAVDMALVMMFIVGAIAGRLAARVEWWMFASGIAILFVFMLRKGVRGLSAEKRQAKPGDADDAK